MQGIEALALICRAGEEYPNRPVSINHKPEAGALVNPSPGSSAHVKGIVFLGFSGCRSVFRWPLKSWLIRAGIAGNAGIFADFNVDLVKNGLNPLM